MRQSVCLLLLLLAGSFLFGQNHSFQMKCVRAEYVDNDTSFCLTSQMGQIIDISISEDSRKGFVGGKIFDKKGKLHYSSTYNEIDFWLYYTYCQFNEDFTKLEIRMHDERMKQLNGKWKNEMKFYSFDLESPVFSSKEEFEIEWNL